MSDELKPCPFCGGKSIHINGNKKRYVSCYICGARTKNGDTTKEAIKRWNERVPCQELVTEPGEDYDFTRFYGYDDTEVDVKFTIDGGKMRIKTSGNLPGFYSEIVIAEWLSVADKDDKKEFATDEEDGFYVSLYLTPRAVSVILAVIKCLEEDFEKTGITVSVKTVYDILTANKEKKSVTNVKIPVFSETSVAD